MGIIFNIQRFCLHDGEGIRTNVFFKGCPLRCIWCHNPEGLTGDVCVSYNRERCIVCGRCVDDCSARNIENNCVIYDRDMCTACGKCCDNCLMGANEIIGKEIAPNEVIKEVIKDKVYYKTSNGGMTLSGGEPSMQADFALSLIELAKNEGISTSIETCGIGNRDFYERALKMGASFLFDIKCIDSEKHKELTGADNGKILSNLEFLFDNGADVVIRLPMVPGINDTDSDISLLCDLLSRNNGKYRYAEIMPYHSFGVEKAKRLGREESFSQADAAEEDKVRWKKKFADGGIDIKISQ